MAKFWALILDNGKRYTQKVDSEFCVTMAVLESKDIALAGAAIKLYLERDKKEFLLCVLTPKACQMPLKIKIGQGETIAFFIQGGPATVKVHLTGYSKTEQDTLFGIPFKGQQQSILVTEPKSVDKAKKRVSIKESPEATRELTSSEEDDLEDDSDEGIQIKGAAVNGLGSSDSEDDIQLIKTTSAKNVQKRIEEEASSDEEDVEEEDGSDEDDDSEEDDDTDEMDVDKVQKPNQKQQSPQKAKQQSPQASPKQAALQRKSEPSAVLKTPENLTLKQKMPSSAGHTPMKFFSKNGVMCQDTKSGTGTLAKLGKMVTVYYCGRLKSNNRKFDASEKGPGFKFRLGKGEVIKGWDYGVEGMKVGGKRRLTIPANLAYGKRGAPPDIPPNSTLVFDVELRNVN